MTTSITLNEFIDRDALPAKLERIKEITGQIAFLKGQLDACESELKMLKQDMADAIEADPEHRPIFIDGMIARRGVKHGRRSVDAISFSSKPSNEPHVLELMRRGGITIPLSALRAGRSAADDAALNYIMPGGEEAWVEIEAL